MSRDPLRLGDYLGHILEAISQIQNYCEDIDEVTFSKKSNDSSCSDSQL